MITIAICDDKQDMRELIHEKTESILSNSPYITLKYDIVTVSCAKELYTHAEHERIDVLLLDIEMPEEDGMQIADRFCELYPKTNIIFVSSHENYVFYSMRFRPFRFIRKDRLEEELPEAILSLLQHMQEDRSTLMINTGRSRKVVHIPDIIYAEKEKRGNYVSFHTVDGVLRERINISESEGMLCENGFCKINSGTLINLRHIIRADAHSAQMSDGANLHVSAKYAPKLTESMIRFFRGKEGNG